MIRKDIVLSVIGTAACIPAAYSNPLDIYIKPNIIIMLIDDAGYADFGFMGCKDLKTPNIDRLASSGVIFTDAHVSASVCAPSRAGILTGRYQQRFGFECNTPSDSCGVDIHELMLASTLKKAGYATGAFGKWHLGSKPGYGPNERGFDYYWGFLSGSRSYFSNKSNDKAGDPRAITENLDHVTFDGYLTDRLGEKAVDFIGRNKDKPFFIYWAPNAVHSPMEATDEDMALFQGHPRQKLAAMTWALDRAIGNIVNQLKKDNQLDNTVIFFLSDNGGATNNQSSNLPLKGFKGNKFEGGHRVAFFATWPLKVKGGTKFEGLTSSLDMYATAIDIAGVAPPQEKPLDGVSLIPFLSGEKKGNPHDMLFWRKENMAAARIGNYKLIRVIGLPSMVYKLDENPEETSNVSDSQPDKYKILNNELEVWEKGLVRPLWSEGEEWDEITRMIHEDLMKNRAVGVTSPAQLKKYKSGINQPK